MPKSLTRVLAFFSKEVHELRRQPRLFASLIGGPFLVLALFGAAFRTTHPILHTVLVWPEAGVSGVQQSDMEDLIRRIGFTLEETVSDRDVAIQRLQAGEIDVVQVVPADIEQQVMQGQQPTLEVLSNTIDPNREAWIQSLAYGEVQAMNRALLERQTAQAQEKAVSLKVDLSQAHDLLAQVLDKLTLSDTDQQHLRQTVRTVRQALETFLVFMPPSDTLSESLSPDVKGLRERIGKTLADIQALEVALDAGMLDTVLDQARKLDMDLLQLSATIDIFSGLPPHVIVSPIQQAYENVRGGAYPMMTFFAPGVLALLIQHLAVTLGGLALVRERLMGAFEIFQVAPLSIAEVLIGKYMGYTLAVCLSALALVGLLQVLAVPLLGSLLLFVALILLLTVASLGVGFLISTVSDSDSQAVQLSMLVLLLSVFFSGFFLNLDSFVPATRVLSVMLPMRHGLEGFRQLMLIGQSPPASVWIGLGLIALVTFALVWLMVQRSYRRLE